MKVKILSNYFNEKVGEIVEAKRYNELTIEESKESIGDYNWEGNIRGVFVQYKENKWIYLIDDEYEIVEE